MATSQMERKNRGNGKVRNMAALSNLAMIAKDMEWKIQNIIAKNYQIKKIEINYY